MIGPLPIEFARSRVSLSEADVEYAVGGGWLTPDHQSTTTETNRGEGARTQPDGTPASVAELSRDKWTYILLDWILEHDGALPELAGTAGSISALRNAIAIAWDDLGFPTQISHLVYFMPSEGQEGTIEENLDAFLASQRKIFGPPMT